MSTKHTLLIVVFLGFILMNGLSLLYLTKPCGASGREIFVDDDFYLSRNGSAEHPYQTISQAIALAAEGDTIYVFGGTYNETLVIDKKVSLVGGIDEGASILSRGVDHKYSVDISADFVTLENFTIVDTGHYITSMNGALIHVTSDNVVLQKNNISCCGLWGIYLDSSNDNTISGNIINATKGVLVSSSNNNVFSYNNISNSSDAAINLRSSIKNILYENHLAMDAYGIYARDCSNTNITHNNIAKNVYHGLYLTGDRNDIISENIFKNNTVSSITMNSIDCIIRDNIFNYGQNGIILQKTGCSIINNSLSNLSSIGISALAGSQNNVISLNHFQSNDVNAKDQGNNQWDDDEKGNYWDTYNYVDRDLNGIGDRPYLISKGVYDWYPLGIFLRPPDKPLNLYPSDDMENVGLKVTLTVKVVDPDSRFITNVSFYNAADNEYIGSVRNVQSGNNASCTLTLPFDTIFAWYTIANDSLLENQSDIWFFTTRQRPPENKKPVADTGGPYVGKVNQTISFNGSQSYDPDGTIIFYRWNFGDGSSQILDIAPEHTYFDPGVYTVTLTVVDNDGRSSMSNTTVTISGEIYINSPPLAMFTAPFTTTVDQPVDFDASESSDIDGTIIGYRWDFNDDGTFDTDWLTTPVVTTTFSTPGNTVVALEVKDDGNASSSYVATLEISPPIKKSPGFELFLVILAILITFLVYIKQKGE
jgi:parallel beta-helix repeat protein